MNLCPEIIPGELHLASHLNRFVHTPETPLDRTDLINGTFLLYMPVGANGQPAMFHEAKRFEAFAVSALPDGGMHRMSQFQMPNHYPDNVWFTHGLLYRNATFYSAPVALGSLGGIITILNQHQISRMSVLDIYC